MTDEEIGHEEKAVLGRADHCCVEEGGTGSAGGGTGSAGGGSDSTGGISKQTFYLYRRLSLCNPISEGSALVSCIHLSAVTR